MRDKVVIFIDKLARKQTLQINAIYRLQLEPVFFVTNYISSENRYFTNGGEQVELKPGLLTRLRQVFSYLKKNKKNIHHIEVYPAGRFSFLAVLLARLFSIKVICAERGDILYYNDKVLGGRFMKFSMWICYKCSDIVWYREPYMKEWLEKIGVKKLFFLHNSIDSAYADDIGTNHYTKDIDFLWLNRVIPQRKSEWVVEILKKPTFSKTNNYLVGYIQNSLFQKEQEYLMQHKPCNLQVFPYHADVREYYKRAKFFILPADVVFANNSLLEAMSYGVVPIVSKQQGSELIVENGVNGFMVEHSQEHFEKIMKEAIHLSEEQYAQYSTEAKLKIKKDFSEQKYNEGLGELYKLCENK